MSVIPTKTTNWFVYIVRCVDGSLYTGSTTDVERRLAEHNGERAGGAKYTRVRQPVALVYRETLESRSAAAKREFEIKQMDKARKERLVGGGTR